MKQSAQGQANVGWLVVLAILVGGIGYGVLRYNRLVRLHEAIPAAWGQVENVLQRRNDLIPNLVATVKGYTKHEQKVYADVDEALKAFNRAQTIAGKIAADNTITGLLSRILALSIQFPTIKADQQFLRLQDELAGTENRIAVERMRFNQAVQDYNSRVKTFPTSLIARWAGLSPSETYFKAVESAQTTPQVAF
jgi:LemA protein